MEAFGITGIGKYPFVPLVDAELFYKAQDILDSKQKNMPKYQKHNPDFPLRGGLLVSECGDKYTASWSTGRTSKYTNYRCRSCKGKGSSKNRTTVEKDFVELISTYEFDPRSRKLLQSSIQVKWKQRNEGYAERKSAIIRQIEVLKLKQRRIVEKNALGVTPDHIAKQLLNDLDQEIYTLESENKNIRSIDETSVEVVSYGLKTMENLSCEWASASLEMKARFQNFLFPNRLMLKRNGKFGTTSPLLLIQLKKTFREEKSFLAAPRGVEPLLPH